MASCMLYNPSREAATANGHLQQTYSKLIYHLVFSTKHRQALIREPIQERLYEYIGGTIRAMKGNLIEIGGVEGHVHILAGLTPVIAVSKAVRDIKANASKWANDIPARKSRFEWQKGYGAFTVSYSQIEGVREYIKNQREHHKMTTFEEEYVRFLERHAIEFERRYLFEAEHHG
jgi:putative transposase